MSVEPTRFVLDSFALLAFLEGEPGAARVKAVLRAAEQHACTVYLSWINLGEVLYLTEREQGARPAREALARVQALPIELQEATSDIVLEAAHIKATHRLSYADAFAVATAQREQATVLTGDPEFTTVAALIAVEWLPQKP